MTRRIGAPAALVVVAGITLGCAQRSSTPPPATPSVQAALREATRLDALAKKLHSEGKSQYAISSIERSLALREQAQGPRHLGVAKSRNDLGKLYEAQGAYAKAEPLFIGALDIREKALGAMHPDVAQSLNELGVLYQMQGVYTKAKPLLLRALDIREKVLGQMNPDVAQSLDSLASLYQAQGAYGKAEPLYVRALDIWERALGPMHPDLASGLNNLANLYQTQGAYGKAELLYVRALDIWEKALGPMHPDLAQSLTPLAWLYQVQGAYAKAELLLVRALNIQEKALGPTHPDVSQSLNSLALLYRAQGAYEKGVPLLVRALDISEKALGPMHPDVARNLLNLALLYKAQGAYGKAELLNVRALSILEKSLGPMHSDVATSLSNLALLYYAQGAYEKAEPLLVRVLDISEKTLGPMHPDVATSLNNLAGIYVKQGAYTKAEPLFLRVLEISEKALGPTHPDVANSLHNLATLYLAQGAYEKGKPLLIRALDILEKMLGPMHPNVADSLNILAAIYQAQGAYGKAESLLIRALDIQEKSLGPMHPDIAKTLNNLAAIYQAQGAYGRTLPLLSRAAEIHEAQLRTEFARLSEPRKRDLMALLQDETKGVVSLHADTMPAIPQALELALTTVLRRKGRILDSLAETQITLRTHLTPKLREQLDQLALARIELSTRIYTPVDPRTAADRTAAIANLRARIDDLESALSTQSVEFRAQSESVTVAKIQAALPRNATLVEFVRYQRFDARQVKHLQEERYVAYLLTSQGPPQWVTLGEAAPIDAAVGTMLAAMHRIPSTGPTKVALQHLDALVFAPIRVRLGNATHVILAPDGKLNLVPFEALVDPQGHYELEQRLISYVTSGRDLLRLATRQAPRSSPTIVAAPDYGPPSSPARNGLGTFRPLVGATAEAADLPAYFAQARSLTGSQATKTALAATVGPAVLHIATHGFYAHEATATSASPDKSTGSAPTASTPPTISTALDSRGIYVDSDPFSALPPLTASEDPTEALDRAGLALAGANVSPDGIVRARELASYDWWGTQLVVLSACETGVGAVPSGEGVYGMRRALVLAGAESQVVSLWNANDASTAELMRAFYGELARGTGRAEALRRAKLRLLRQPQFAHPYYWAAFIPAGDWTPLDPHLLKRQEHGQ
jgi:CHAT domain-containing protein